MKVGVIGNGFVGANLAKVLEEAHNTVVYDKFQEGFRDPSVLSGSKVIFICVPTPMKPDGEIDLSVVEDAIVTLKNIISTVEKPLIVIRSTTVPGTADDLAQKYPFDFASNPEFLREKHALEDMKNTRRIIIGAENHTDYLKVAAVYIELFPNGEYVSVDRKTAEMIKYSSNSLLAGQIALANEIYQICNVLEIDYKKVKDALLLDDRIARNIDVPGHDGDLGFGGKCLPKDLNALISHATKKGNDPKLLREVWNLNNRLRKDKNWQNIIGATSENNYHKDSGN